MTDETPTPVAGDDLTGSFRPTSPSPVEFAEVEDYRILQKLAEGGMGEVYEAEQLRPVRRRVALKLIKLGMDSKEVLARFETERQALAVMNHPNIAKVFDAGTTESGRPYFAMELVRGVPITEFCDTERLNTRERLELFVPVCEGIQHAHQKGIIHRDIKPSNVLVALQDDQPVPKIIDFGIAKATAQPLTGRTVYTQLGRLIGTPEYMSPEQAEMTGLDIDTRTDIYSLGAVLYEVLAGALPFEPETFRTGTLSDIQRQIREREPPRPSSRAGSAKESSVAAQRRKTEPAKLVKQLRGDLDWIVLKAMEKERTRRYETANALALDIRSHLQDEPVRARPPSTAYRLTKFVRRNRLAVAGASLVLLAILGGVVGTSVGLVRSRQAEQAARVAATRARQAERLAREAEARAFNEAETAREVSDFLVGLFKDADPGQTRGATITARQILDRGADRIEKLKDRPATQALMMHTIGTVHEHLGLYQEARDLLEKALDLRVNRESDGLEVAESLDGLAALFMKTGNFEEAEARARKAMEIRKSLLKPDDPRLADSLARLAWVLVSTDRHEEAEPLFHRALDIQTASLGESAPDLADRYHGLGMIRDHQKRYEEAVSLLDKARSRYQNSPESSDVQLRKVLNDLGTIFWKQGKFREAEETFRQALEIKEGLFGPDHPEVASTLSNLALLNVYQALKMGNRKELFEQAEQLFLRALAIKEKAAGPNHVDVGTTLNGQAFLYYHQERYEEAQPLFERARSIFEDRNDRSALATLLDDFAQLKDAQGQHAEAETMRKRASALRESAPDS